MSRKKWISLAVIAALLLTAGRLFHKIAKVPSGYIAKVACSEIFAAGRAPSDVMETNFDNISPFFDWVDTDINEAAKTVSTSLFGFGKSVARFSDNLGCGLAGRGIPSQITIPSARSDHTHTYETEINPDVQSALMDLFDDTALPNPIITRGALVVQNGVVIAEHYAEGFEADTRQQSWSTAKGVTQALIGIAARDGHLSLDDAALFPSWSGEKAKITIGHLLHMASGLEFTENYANPTSHVDQMLFNQRDMGGYAAERKLIHTPGTVSAYSSGTTNILSKLLRARLEKKGEEYHTFPQAELFGPLSMSSAIFEVDGAGNFIGSSYIYATPRDFARFGQLYLQGGLWEGTRILPQSWVAYTGEPAPGTGGKYGSHWSLNLNQSTMPGLPDNVIHLGGNDGQMIVVIPSENTVIVRMGLTRYPANLENDVYPLIAKVYAALPNQSAP